MKDEQGKHVPTMVHEGIVKTLGELDAALATENQAKLLVETMFGRPADWQKVQEAADNNRAAAGRFRADATVQALEAVCLRRYGRHLDRAAVELLWRDYCAAANKPIRAAVDAKLADVIAVADKAPVQRHGQHVTLADIEAVVRTPAKQSIKNRMTKVRAKGGAVPEPLKLGGTADDLYLYSALRTWLIEQWPDDHLDARLPANIGDFSAELARCEVSTRDATRT